MSTNDKHNEHTRLISLKPGLIGLSDIILSTNESNLFKDGHLYRQPDNLMFDYKNKTIYNINVLILVVDVIML